MKDFNIPSSGVVITSIFVVNEKMPVLYVSHEPDEEDGASWQFHCGNNIFDTDKMMLVTLDNMLKLDGSLKNVADLPENYCARRTTVDEPWTYHKI